MRCGLSAYSMIRPLRAGEIDLLNLADFAPDKVRELRTLMLDRTQELLKKYGHDDPLYTQSIYDGLASQLIPLTRKLAE